jgi:hypothetical protein
MRFDFFGRNVLDVGLADIQLFNLGMVEVETSYALTDVGKPKCEREAYVSAADNSYFDALVRKKLRFPLHTYSPCAYPLAEIRKMHELKQ